MRRLSILGIRGLPAKHGGFETFAESLALYLIKNGWSVTVYCQEENDKITDVYESVWNGVRLVHIPVNITGAIGTIIFDYKSIKKAIESPSLVLTLGYNTAVFNFVLRLNGIKNLINMDGIEWKRNKWRWYEKIWLYLNERIGCLVGNHLIADHPEIKNHLATRVVSTKITMIPYGARSVNYADRNLLSKYQLEPGSYALVIARPEPENSILEIVRAFSEKQRGIQLVVLGKYDRNIDYHRNVLDAASEEITFAGAVYDHKDLDALRLYSCLYIHGHTVGGTNPSLIEALGSAQPVLAHDNKFNRWVAGESAAYFKDEESCSEHLDLLLSDTAALQKMSDFSRLRFDENFTWDEILKQYEDLLLQWV